MTLELDPTLSRDELYDRFRDLYEEWVDANLPLMRNIYRDPERLRFWHSFGAGILASGLMLNPAEAYAALEMEVLTANNRIA